MQHQNFQLTCATLLKMATMFWRIYNFQTKQESFTKWRAKNWSLKQKKHKLIE